MKRLLTLLACLLLFGAAHGEAAPEPAALAFRSFAGGGHVYTAEAEDPDILSISVSRDGGDASGQAVSGATFNTVFTFTGLRPGETTVAVYGRSPILENDDHLYAATVDEALNVALTPVRALAVFYLYRGGELAWPMYRIAREPDGYRLSVDEGPERIVAPEAMDALMEAIDAYDVAAWDGFSESTSFVLDGETFWLEFALTDGTRVRASGDNAFPENYFEAMGAMWTALEGAEAASVEAAEADPD